MVTRLLIAILLCGFADDAGAKGLPPSDAVALAETALLAAGMADASPIAPSRPLPDCAGEITVDPPQAAVSTVTLRCAQPNWSRSLRTGAAPVPENRQASAAPLSADAPMALALRRSMARDEVIAPEDLVSVPLSDLGPEQVFTNPKDLIGRRLDRSVAAKRPVLARHLQPDWIVQEGQPVAIISSANGIRISMQGRAEINGAYGDLINVTNLSSGRSVAARVMGRDIVEVILKPFVLSP